MKTAVLYKDAMDLDVPIVKPVKTVRHSLIEDEDVGPSTTAAEEEEEEDEERVSTR